MPKSKEKIFSGLFHLSVVRRLLPHLALVAIYAVAIVLLHPHLTLAKVIADANAALFIGIILSMLLVFRTNSAYDRWWEARKAWGQLVNDSRNLCLKFDQLVVDADESERRELGILVAAYAVALKDHLRSLGGVHAAADAPAPLTEDEGPVEIAHKIYGFLIRQYQLGRFDSQCLNFLDSHAKSLMDVLGTCERISSSPITITHKGILLQIIAVYILLLPWSMAPTMGFLGIPFVLVGSYMVLGLELIAEEKEHPFGEGEEDLELDKFCRTIERSTRDILHLDELHSATRDGDSPSLRVNTAEPNRGV